MEAFELASISRHAYETCNFSIILFFVVTFFALTVGGQKALYGRYTTSKLGPTVSGRIDWLGHLLSILPFFYFALYNSKESCLRNPVNIFLSLLFITHYLNRGLFHAVLVKSPKPIPIVTLLMTSAFCAANGFLQAVWLLQFILGCSFHLLGMYINIRSDHILMNLRKPGESGYKVPRGFLFEYVSGANFLGEIIEWTGFAIATWSLSGLMFAVATICNIGPRAMSHHKWYLSKFEDYPQSRKALIPYVL